MNEAYNYTVVIQGLDKIPLRTTAHGAKMLMQSFHDEPNMENLLLEAVDGGRPFKNKLVSVSAITVSANTKPKMARRLAKTKTPARKR